jgi:ABC-type branched-subunit amino acid transport system substrate-binding protein
VPATYKVGFLQEFVMVDHAQKPWDDALRMALDEAFEDGLLDRPIELVHKVLDGLPTGTWMDVRHAWQELAAEGVVCILGPITSENAISLRGYIEDQGRVPTLSITGTDKWYGEYCFCLNNGSLPEDPYLMANFLAAEGSTTTAVVYDRSATGYEYLDFFRQACEFEGISMVFAEPVGQLQTEWPDVVRRAQASGADSLSYLGLGLSVLHANKALAQVGWAPRLKVMNTGFMTAPIVPEGLASIAGWVGCDQYDEENVVTQDFLARFEKRYGYRPESVQSTLAYDCGALMAQALSKAHPMTPDGVKDGLEKIKMYPAATGGNGGVLSFAPFVRRPWLTKDFIVLREVPADFTGETLMTGPNRTVMRHKLQPRTYTERHR